jgi:hypothetical protein
METRHVVRQKGRRIKTEQDNQPNQQANKTGEMRKIKNRIKIYKKRT